jgi:hypothetical protein
MSRFHISLSFGALLLLLAAPGLAQQLMVDNFDYPAGEPLTDHGWIQIRGGTQATVADGGLDYAGYPLSGIGNAASLVTGNGGECKRTDGSVYVTFLVRPDDVTTESNDGILLYLGPEDSNIFGRRLTVYINEDGEGKVRFGVRKSSGIGFIGYDHSIGEVLLVVARYQFLPGDGDDTVSLWINPDLEQPEPEPDRVVATGDDAANIAQIVLSQLDAETPTAWVDGLHIGTSWGIAPAPPVIFVDGFEGG